MTDGQVLAGRYEIGAVLGRGGMAEVRAGWDLRLGRAVAVKTLLPGLAEQSDIRRRFEGEARAAAKLAHPNAVAVFDVGEDSGVPFLVMEQVVGPTLEQEMARGVLDAGRVRRLGQELLAALGAAHGVGLVHRDVKPANVLIAADGSAKVADFGIAKAVGDEDAAALQMDLTSTGQLIGTLAYMAPERLAGQPATVQSDIYSVGVVLYEGLAGVRPFAAPTPVAIVRAIDQAAPVPLRDRCPDIDAALIAAVERAMAKEPEDRFASAAEMSAALRTDAELPGGAMDAPTVVAAAAVMVGSATELLDAPPAAATAAASLAAASAVRPAWRTSASRFTRRQAIALLIGVGLAVALVAAVTVGGRPHSAPAVTPTVTAPPTTLLSPPPPQNPTTSPATSPTGGHRGKGKDNKD